MQAALACARLGGAEDDDVGEAEFFGDRGQARTRDERDFDAGQTPLVDLVKTMERRRRDDGAQDGVAEKLESLVGVFDRLALRRGRMRDRGKQKLLTLETMPDDLSASASLRLCSSDRLTSAFVIAHQPPPPTSRLQSGAVRIVRRIRPSRR